MAAYWGFLNVGKWLLSVLGVLGGLGRLGRYVGLWLVGQVCWLGRVVGVGSKWAGGRAGLLVCDWAVLLVIRLAVGWAGLVI